MAKTNSAPFALRAHRACLAAAVVGALLTTGCNHRRSVLRPVLPAPRAVAAPGCTNCGSGGTTVIEQGSPVIREGGPVGASASEPIIEGARGSVPSDVPLEAPTSSTRKAPSATTERRPTATPDEPDLDLSPTSSAPTRSRSLRQPINSTPRSSAATPPPAPAPDLTAPASGEGKTSMGSGDGKSLKTASAAGVVRRASTSGSLDGYFAADAADDLYYPNKADRPWKYVVVHHSATEAGSYADIDAEHRKLLGFDGCGYHFVIGNGTGSGDGQIEVSQRWVNQKHGVHCRNARRADIDEYGIGIAMIGDFEKAPPTPRQVAAIKSLLAYLGDRYKIGQDRVETHSHVAATPTVCPGKHFPTDALDLPASKADVHAQADATPDPTPVAPSDRRAMPTAWRVSGSAANAAPAAPR